MKNTFLMMMGMLISLAGYSQSYDYKKAWEKVEQFQKERKPESAIKVLNEIYDAAANEGNGAQSLRVFATMPGLIILDTDGKETSHLAYLEDRLTDFASPESQVAHLIVFHYLMQYYNENQYLIQDRTSTGSLPDDVKEWAPENYETVLLGHLEQAMERYEDLAVEIESYATILNEFNDRGKKLRPYLLDVVAYQIIDLLQNPLLSASDFQPLETSSGYYAPLDSFIQLDITSHSGKSRILKVYQKILSIHQARNNYEALLDSDLQRIKYINSLAIQTEKDSLYQIGLRNLRESHDFEGANTIIDLEKANHLFSSSFVLGQESRRLEAYNIAIKILEEDSENVDAQNLINRITRKNYDVTTKQVHSTDKNLDIQVTSTNVEKLAYTIVEIDDEPTVFYRKNQDEIRKYITSLKKADGGTLKIEKGEYFNETNQFFKITNPGPGYYAIYFENDGGFCYNTFYVSDLAYVAKQNGGLDIVVANRITGDPVKEATVKFYLNVFDRNTRTNQFRLLSSLTTDSQGKVNFPAQSLNGSIKISVEKGKDKILLEDSYYIYDSPGYENYKRREAFIITDRAIYRPGQMIHFKAILIGYHKNIPEIRAKENVIISLKDANGSEIMTRTLVSNEFGSAASSFVLPATGLTGTFSLSATSGNFEGYRSIQVEEYRRPKFEVLLDKPTDGFRLGDSITVKGNAASYTSVPVTEGKVTYNVYRQERRWWWDYYRPSGGEDVLIASGSTLTDDEGKFQFPFKSLGDAGHSYIFRVEVDVLDLSGETRSATMEIVVSDKEFQLFTDAVSLMDIGDTTLLSYHVQNNSGEEIAFPTSWQITRLEDPGYLLDVKNRNEIRSDNNIEAILKQWKTRGVVKSRYVSDLTRKVDFSGLDAGGYKIEIYAGNQSYTKYIAISDRNKKLYPFVQTLFVHMVKDNYSPGEKARFIFGTPFKNLNIYVEDERNDQVQSGRWIKISNQKIVDFPVGEKDLGGFGVKFWAIKNNNITSDNRLVAVPWNHKNLEISYATFRDNLLPGENEKWIMKISGADKDAVAAELCASLYDVSLDQFLQHTWTRSFYPSFRFTDFWNPVGFDLMNGRHLDYNWNQVNHKKTTPVIYPYFNFMIHPGLYETRVMMRGRASGVIMNEMSDAPAPDAVKEEYDMAAKKSASNMESADFVNEGDDLAAPTELQIRQNLEETVFFMPQLHTDEEGNVLLEFKMGEALTKWKLLLFAHDQQFRVAFSEKEVITRKDLMIIPYAPRFVRQGDVFQFSGKLSNLSDSVLAVSVHLKLFNAATGEEITGEFGNGQKSTQVNVEPGGSSGVSFEVRIPESIIDPIEYRMVASTPKYSDGESGILPVVSNKIYVTDTWAFTLSSGEKKSFNIGDLIKSGRPLSLGFDYTAHPVWTVIQALPTLNDYPHECTEQILNKYFAQALGEKILNSIPNIDQILDQWMQPESSALLSNLEKNNEFKSTTLENTPWVMDGRNESDQKRLLANFLNKNDLHYRKVQLLEKLESSQNSDGGFPWFKGGRSNVYITQYLLENLAKMRDLGLISGDEHNLDQLITEATSFIDEEAGHRYNDLLRLEKEQKIKLEDDHLKPVDVHYLYTKNLYEVQNSDTTAFYAYYLNQAYKYWVNKSDMTRALIAKIAFENDVVEVVNSIMQSFNERVLVHPELGAYWKQSSGYNWYQLPIETHTAMMELYQEVDEDNPLIEKMQLWLLNHKRTNAWSTTKSTASAIYALLKSKDGSLVHWSGSNISPEIMINNMPWNGDAELATGYIIENRTGKDADEFETLEITNRNNNVGWGGLYVRYLAPINEIEDHAQGSISIRKSLFVRRPVDGVEQLIPVSSTKINVGEKIVSRMVIITDRDMSFLHLQDMRASGLEPINVISNYKWKGGFGYYESTRDAATHFFIDYLPKGSYVFEHELRVSHSGEFSNGISTLQSMYAPEFSAHSNSSQLAIN